MSDYICDAVDFRANVNALTHAAALTGVADSKRGIFSAWMRADAFGLPDLPIFSNAALKFIVDRNVDGTFRARALNAASSNVMTLVTNSAYRQSSLWRHVLMAWDLAATSTVTARYFRAKNFTFAASDFLELGQFELLTGSTVVNLPSGVGPAPWTTITSSFAPAFGGTPLGNLNDQSGSTYSPILTNTTVWTRANAIDPTFYIQFDLGGAKLIDGLRLGGGSAGDPSNRYPTAFDLQYSTDGISWAPLTSFTGMTYPGDSTLSAIKPVNLIVPAAQLYIDDFDDKSASSTLVNDTISYATTNWAAGFVYGLGQEGFANGCLADLYFAPGQYLDMSIAANRRKFIDASGYPVDLGADGSTPTGAAPAVFMHLSKTEAPNDFAINRGPGGNFVFTPAGLYTTLGTASSSPTDRPRPGRFWANMLGTEEV